MVLAGRARSNKTDKSCAQFLNIGRVPVDSEHRHVDVGRGVTVRDYRWKSVRLKAEQRSGQTSRIGGITYELRESLNCGRKFLLRGPAGELKLGIWFRRRGPVYICWR